MVQLIDKTALRKELSKLPSEIGFVRKSDVMQILGSQKCRNRILDIVRVYNKAIDDFSERIKQVTYTSGNETDGYYKIHAICERDIDEIAEQLKAGYGNDITASNGKESL